ncbi:peptidoglycan recognition protein family protein [Streptococcus pneumoniae]|uniref:peptidoglycan recognition protein family protein n=1 Tax=Streptococcus pneumoniae TaxID=1313 RepID=UPI0005DE5559|nr:N-acetylmuramoyl-L-alanine amidase family protein [Streptococcus pneumoniae]CIX25849.1 autolysin [Streptococcus pneumoniae]COC02548.1 autolysin [Streptococcus pneumoniae]COD28573.1 autolysin [Streptococcus pneumoniae]COO63795.1 autolysin [Streptococcus pneumoniae]
MDIDRNRLRTGLPQVGVQPYRQVHAHSTGNRNSTVQNEADYHYRKDPELGFFSHVVGNGRVMQVGPVNNGSWDVGGGWNAESYAAVELIESHSTKEEFMADYRLYIELLRNLADEAGLPKTLDTDDLAGIKTHEYCTNNQPNNHSDHVDPYPYLAKWGISREQFKHDIENGLTIETGWQKNGTGYWYVHSDGNWYWFDNSGEMATGWKKIADKWYYFDVEGAMQTGWVKYKDTWYYLDAKEGAMVSNAFIQSADGTGWYYLKPDGTLADKPEFTVEPDGLITVK